MTDVDGRFEITDCPIGVISLRVEHGQHAWHIDGPFDIRSSVTVTRMIQLLGRGRLTGTAPAGAEVHLHAIAVAGAPDYSAVAKTDTKGLFTFTQPLLPGSYWVFAHGKAKEPFLRWHEARVMIKSGRPPRVVLNPGGSGGIRGRAARRWSFGRIRLTENGTGAGPWARIPVDDRREFEIRGLPPGRYDVHGFGVIEVRDGIANARR